MFPSFSGESSENKPCICEDSEENQKGKLKNTLEYLAMWGMSD